MEQQEKVAEVNLGGLDDPELLGLSRRMLLSLDINEMKKIKEEFSKLGRNPTDAELETIAQTWSEHCKHKVFNCTIEFEGQEGKETIEGLFKTYIAGATNKIVKNKKGFLVSVFSDNAGIINFNKKFDVCMKVETHNHPSALEPYGGANTGLGGVIRDVLGCGLGAKPIANTDVFCFAEPWTEASQIPKGVLHPKRIFKGVRQGVKDYGNRMGIPTVNGAIIFDKRYLGNPLVYCGTVGLLPKGMHKKEAAPKELIVAVGARTGKDGLHGATFSSIGLEESSPVSAVQIGNAIEERKLMDALLRARDEGLYTCITDCGAGGFSSAIGEMGAEIGARVELEKAPLKYKGMKPWEIWLSESQERMIISVPKKNLKALHEICGLEDVEATVIGEFTNTKKLEVYFGKEKIIELEMEFLHNGVPKQRRTAKYIKPIYNEPQTDGLIEYGSALHSILKMPNVASKERTVRQYDHEVQGGSVLKPFVGIGNDAPGDAAIVRPLLDSNEAIVIANGINSMFGDISPYWMAASCIDEAIRNAVAVGADPGRIALLDNFSWGNPDKPIKLAELVLACKACHDIAIEFETPFISGKDSLYNEYDSGKGKHISVPGTLLISLIGVMEDSRKKISMDLKEVGNSIYVLGKTFNELGGSHYYRIFGNIGNKAPKVDAAGAKKLYTALHNAMDVGSRNSERVVRSCHDCSEGGVAVAAAEMCFGGNMGMEIDVSKIVVESQMPNDALLFSESNSRFVVEVRAGKEKEFEKIMKGCDFAAVGTTTKEQNLTIKDSGGNVLIKEKVPELKKSWKETLDW